VSACLVVPLHEGSTGKEEEIRRIGSGLVGG
jgi:hypothetical protein